MVCKANLKLIRKVIRQIVESCHPQKIVLFGSYAYGKPKPNSDVDLLVVMRSRKRPIDREIEVSRSLRFYPFPMDILVRTPLEIRRRIQMGDPFYLDVVRTRGKPFMSLKLSREWAGKAEEDFQAALLLSEKRGSRLLNAVCFHSQQAAEKYFKS
jgi:predicted nucleotidyltransferase